ncbi:MAG: BASS family bile acid:Na+ symporter [Paracoccaceae bacterium]|jgi:BASS family bile acid:Na+ symporter
MFKEMLDSFFNNYASFEYPLASTQLVLAMLGMGALLSPRDFLLEVKTPRALLTGLGFQWLMVPLIALTLASTLPVPAGIAAGLIVIAAVPGGTLSNILTHFGQGNITLSISLTAITTVAALVFTPLLLELLISQHLPADFDLPASSILREIVLMLLLPLAAGMGMQRILGLSRSAIFSRWVIRLSLLMIVLMAVGAGGSGRLDPKAYGVIGVVALVAFCLSVQLAGWLTTRLMRLSHRDSMAIVIEASFRNMSLAVAIKALIFPAQPGQVDPIGDAIFFTALLYGGVSLLMSLVPVFAHRRLGNAPDATATELV